MSLSSTDPPAYLIPQPPMIPLAPENSDPDPENEAGDEAAEDYTDETGINYDIPPPPVDLFYKTLDEALQSIQKLTKEHGYALTKLRSKKGKDGEVKKVYLQCDRGKSRASGVQEQNRRKFRSTRFLDCL
jgi:hypothetical protein